MRYQSASPTSWQSRACSCISTTRQRSTVSICETLWHHKPITDFWRIKRGIQRKLLRLGIGDMYGVAHTPLDVLQKAFGVDAIILWDHSWGREPTTIAEIKAYRPAVRSVSVGQVLLKDYDYDGALLVVREMADELA